MNLCDLAKYVDRTQNWLVFLGILIYWTQIDLTKLITRWLFVKYNLYLFINLFNSQSWIHF